MSNTLRIPVGKADHSAGPETASVTLVQYGDYQCPHCRVAFPVVKRLQSALANNLRFVYRNFPLSNVHPDAINAARAAEAAAQQGKFWEMHDLLYERQESLGVQSLLSYAESLRLDLNAFRSAMDDPNILARIQRDFEGGVNSGVNGTPTFFVNGFRYDGDWSYGHFHAALTDMVKRQSAHR